jgi:hypothetical protein
MNRRILMALPCAMALLACGGGNPSGSVHVIDDGGPSISVPEAVVGVHVVATGSEQAPATGYYYVGDDGAATLAIEDASSTKAKQLYRRNAGGRWRAVPGAEQDVQVTFLERRIDTVVATSLAELAGHYAASVANGTVAVFDVTVDGRALPSAGSACGIQGKVLPSSPAGVFRVEFTASNCADVADRLSGTLVSNPAWVAQKFSPVPRRGQPRLRLVGLRRLMQPGGRADGLRSAAPIPLGCVFVMALSVAQPRS